ncbi:MAG: ABC transporter permease subunit, partial [Lachnospiraceae bacterium]|nr:ABC transporter permease subunit [Lachnospiraceae bacterium]
MSSIADADITAVKNDSLSEVKKKSLFFRNTFINLANLLFLMIWAASFLPSRYDAEMRNGLRDFKAFGVVLIIIEAIFLIYGREKKRNRAARDIVAFVYAFLLIWEVGVSRFNLLPFAFVPAPENVFYVFYDDYLNILEGFKSSMILILLGVFLALFFAVILGTLVGWVPRLTNAVYPIVKAISTVPPLIYTSYIVLIMPTFFMASLTVVFLSVFWGSFMGSINNTAFVEKKVINSARVLNMKTLPMLFKIIIPFNLPRIINNLPINLATALMTLTAAEMIGATSGMGYYVRVSLTYANYTKAIAGIIFIGVVVS